MRLRNSLVLLACCLAGCAGGFPWRKAPPAAPEPVQALAVVAPADAPMSLVLQYWERNTLVVDLGSVAPQGTLQLRPRDAGRWPTRLALRFPPGRFEAVEVRGGQRVLYPATSEAGAPATVQLPPAVHAGDVPQLTLRWGPKAGF